uniref:Uncharacterized protein n=1 Tax=Phage sp. ctR9T2 TaxID=2825795 RepID=A0A8S5UFV0_9VIRU|nr:MAG TPA: hypothetical protein [Phage sp. ctR9T2]
MNSPRMTKLMSMYLVRYFLAEALRALAVFFIKYATLSGDIRCLSLWETVKKR